MPADSLVHVVDDDRAVRQSLGFLLASAGFPVTLHEFATDFLNSLSAETFGCILADVRMPGIDGIEFLRHLRKRGISVPVIVMTGHADVSLAVEAMKEGAFDFIEKPFDDELLLSTLREALSKHKDASARSEIVTAVKSRMARLTEREAQVLEHLIAGRPNKIIAFELSISPRTVELYRANVMTKMQVRSLSELVRMVISTRDSDKVAKDLC